MNDPPVHSPAPGPDAPASCPLPRRQSVTHGRPPRHAGTLLLALTLALISAATLALPALLSPVVATALPKTLKLTAPNIGAGPSVGVATALEASARPAGTRVPPLHAPVTGPLLRAFEESAGPFGAGHRGLDFGAAPGADVRAPASGRVTFSGKVVGTTWVTIEVAPGVLVTLGPLRTVPNRVGQRVPLGGAVGTLAPGHPIVRSPSPTRPMALAALHLGLRVHGVYVDPLPWLADLARPRLAPLAEPGGPH